MRQSPGRVLFHRRCSDLDSQDGYPTDMESSLLKRWVVIGLLELALALFLAAIAPQFINSDFPWVGLLIWLGILLMLGSSGLHVILGLHRANQARRYFIRQFPEYRDLSSLDFLGLSRGQVLHALQELELMQSDPDFQSLNLSPLEFLRGVRK